MFTLWVGLPHRATRDIDLHGIGDPSEAHLRKVMLDVISQPVDDDGVLFDAGTLTVAPIREDQAYGGVRVALLARIASAQIRLQIDVGFGDAITPEATSAEFPALLEPLLVTIVRCPRERKPAAHWYQRKSEKCNEFQSVAIATDKCREVLKRRWTKRRLRCVRLQTEGTGRS